jgi:putative membrane protein
MRLTIALTTAAALALTACGSRSEAPDAAATAGRSRRDHSDEAMGTATGAMAGDTAAMPTTAQGFADAAAASDMFEIESSRLAQTMAKNQAVKDFASMLVTEHTKSTTELKAAAGKATPPVTPAPKMTPQQQSDLDALKNAGANFDTLYAQKQVPAHEKALALLQGYAANGDSEPLKAFATKTAPVVEKHLAAARKLPK